MSGIAAVSQIAQQGQAVAEAATPVQTQSGEGQAIRALVASITAQGLATLLIEGKPVSAALPPGTAAAGAWLTLARTELPNGTAAYRIIPQSAADTTDAIGPSALRTANELIRQTAQALPPSSPEPSVASQGQSASKPLLSPHAAQVAETLDAAVAKAVTSQKSLASLIVTAQTVADQSDLGLPAALRALTATIAAQGLDAGAPITPRALADSIARSGVFQEARLASPSARPDLIRHDMKGLLLALIDLAASLRSEDKTGSDRPVPSQTLAQAPPLPRRDGSIIPEQTVSRAATAAIGIFDGESMLETLSHDAEGALDRIRLQQHASLSESAPGASQASAKTPPQVMMLEVPLILQQAMTMVQMRFSGGGQGAGGRDPGLGWRVEFSLDAGEVGPVHADIGLRGEAVAVTLHVEDAEAAIAMRGEADALADLLAQEGLDSSTIRILNGRPLVKPGAGYYLDRQS